MAGAIEKGGGEPKGMMGRGAEGAGTWVLHLRPTLEDVTQFPEWLFAFPCSGLTSSSPGFLWATGTEFALPHERNTSCAVRQSHVCHWAERVAQAQPQGHSLSKVFVGC